MKYDPNDYLIVVIHLLSYYLDGNMLLDCPNTN